MLIVRGDNIAGNLVAGGSGAGRWFPGSTSILREDHAGMRLVGSKHLRSVGCVYGDGRLVVETGLRRNREHAACMGGS